MPDAATSFHPPPMTYHTPLAATFAWICALPLSAAPAPAAVQPAPATTPALAGSRPNIVLIFSDDHALGAIGAYGSNLGVDATPNLDRMAAQGMRFDNCLCGNSLCGPSRATVLTGKFSHANGFSDNDHGRFDGTQPTLPKYLHQAGYETAIFGKWHLITKPTGFDDYEVHFGQGIYYNARFLTPKGPVKTTGYATDLTIDMALNWLDHKHDAKKPFLLMIQPKAPHRNWQPGPQEIGLWKGHHFPEPPTLFDDYANRGPGAAKQQMEVGRDMHLFYDLHVSPDCIPKGMSKGDLGVGWQNRQTAQPTGIDDATKAAWSASLDDENQAFFKNPPKGKDLTRWKYQRYMMQYMRCVKGVDRNVGRVLDYLKEHGLDKNTIVLYSSDQGFFLGEHGWFDKRWIYEESLHMPLIAYWPGHIPAGVVQKGIVQNTDFLPTFMALAGLQAPAGIHGQSMVPLLENKTQELHEAAYYHYYEKGEHNVPRHVGIRTPRYTMAWFYAEKKPYWELFDREKDPQEMKSVYDDPAYANVRADLTAQLTDLAKKYQDHTPPWGSEEPAATGGHMD